MSTWHYERGTWTETAFLDDWQDGEDSGAVRKRLGYEPHFQVGDGHLAAFSIKLYSRTEAPQYLIELDDLNLCEMVLAETLPDALDLLARYAPIVTAAEFAAVVSDIRTLDPCGIVTDVLAAAQANRREADTQATRELRERRERAEQWRKRQAAPSP